MMKGQKLIMDNDYCEHLSKHTDTVEVTYFIGETDMSYEREVYVCDDCGDTLELEQGDPAADRADYLADVLGDE